MLTCQLSGVKLVCGCYWKDNRCFEMSECWVCWRNTWLDTEVVAKSFVSHTRLSSTGWFCSTHWWLSLLPPFCFVGLVFWISLKATLCFHHTTLNSFNVTTTSMKSAWERPPPLLSHCSFIPHSSHKCSLTQRWIRGLHNTRQSVGKVGHHAWKSCTELHKQPPLPQHVSSKQRRSLPAARSKHQNTHNYDLFISFLFLIGSVSEKSQNISVNDSETMSTKATNYSASPDMHIFNCMQLHNQMLGNNYCKAPWQQKLRCLIHT